MVPMLTAKPGLCPTVSAEGERVGLHARVEELDFKRPIRYCAALAYELIDALLGDDTNARGIDIGPMAVSGRFAINRYTEPDRLTPGADPSTRCTLRAWNR
jgi:hypothetical protein